MQDPVREAMMIAAQAEAEARIADARREHLLEQGLAWARAKFSDETVHSIAALGWVAGYQDCLTDLSEHESHSS